MSLNLHTTLRKTEREKGRGEASGEKMKSGGEGERD